MSMRRFFVVKNPDWVAALTEHKKKEDVVYEARTTFFNAWGAKDYMVGGFGDEAVVALPDPRLMTPSKVLPKGWVKSKHYGYVRPGKSIPDALRHLDLPYPTEVCISILTLLLAAVGHSPELSHCIAKNNPRWMWFDASSDKTYYSSPRFLWCEGSQEWVVSIPDPTLNYTALEGLEEVFEWQVKEKLGAQKEAA